MPDLSDAQKAKVAFVITLIGSLATWAITEFPDSTAVQDWGGIITAVLTILVTTYGVYQTTNRTQPAPATQVPPTQVPPTQLPPAA